MDLKTKLQTTPTKVSKPQIFNLRNNNNVRQLKKLFSKKKNLQVNGNFSEQLKELFAINNPPMVFSGSFNKQFKAFEKNLNGKIEAWRQGRWVYFPWLETLVHILEEKDFFKVRTARNKLLITHTGQEKFYNAKIGIAGLSIGSSVAAALVLQGGAKHLRLADFDSLTLSNTNRIRVGIHNLGLPKIEIIARQIYETNPYTKIEFFTEGITGKNVKRFVKGLNVLVDEMDSLSSKLLLRIEAKKNKVPIVMGADNADMAVVDIERYDVKQKIRFFHGRIKQTNYKKLQTLNKFETGKTIVQLMGLENHTPAMLSSLQAMGETLVSWPQLGGTAMLNGACVAYCVRKIVCGESLEDNRAIISLDKILQKNYGSKAEKLKRQKTIKNYKKIFKL